MTEAWSAHGTTWSTRQGAAGMARPTPARRAPWQIWNPSACYRQTAAFKLSTHLTTASAALHTTRHVG